MDWFVLSCRTDLVLAAVSLSTRALKDSFDVLESFRTIQKSEVEPKISLLAYLLWSVVYVLAGAGPASCLPYDVVDAVALSLQHDVRY
jgi:hypothetical protein